MIAENLKSVRRRIADASRKAGRSPEEVELICVTKEASIEEVEEVVGLGLSELGENRVQDALSKYSLIGDRARWHMVGHLQTNKARSAVKLFSLIHSVDSVRLAEEIDKEAKKIGKVQDILIQVNPVRNIISNGVNTSDEKTKFGIAPTEVFDFFKKISLYHNIRPKGLMTIAPEVDDAEVARPYFRTLRELRDRINELRITNHDLRILSMGMSNDFEVAIEEGSNMIRLGRAIFTR